MVGIGMRGGKRVRLPHWPRAWPGVDLVGESYSRADIAALVQNGVAPTLAFLALTLFPEPDNPHDPNAVAVLHRDVKLGHLSRDHALAYRRAAGISPSTCDGVITGGQTVDGRVYDYSVIALMSLADSPAVADSPAHLGVLSLDARRLSGAIAKNLYVCVSQIRPELAHHCEPGEQVVGWIKEGMDEVHFFAKGTVGGAGRLAVVPAEDLVASGIRPESATAYIRDVGRFYVILNIVGKA